MVTQPSGAYLGKVLAATKVSVQSHIGMLATGIVAVEVEGFSFGASGAEVSGSSTLTISGLTVGDDIIHIAQTKHAPILIEPLNGVSIGVPNEYDHPTAVYTIGNIVSMEHEVEMTISRDGIFPEAAHAEGTAEPSGFDFFIGNFNIVP